MQKAPPSEASGSTQPCSTSPRALCSFSARRRGRAPVPSCQELTVGFALASLSLKGEPAAPGPASPDCSGAAWGERAAGPPLSSCCRAHSACFPRAWAGQGRGPEPDLPLGTCVRSRLAFVCTRCLPSPVEQRVGLWGRRPQVQQELSSDVLLWDPVPVREPTGCPRDRSARPFRRCQARGAVLPLLLSQPPGQRRGLCPQSWGGLLLGVVLPDTPLPSLE